MWITKQRLENLQAIARKEGQDSALRTMEYQREQSIDTAKAILLKDERHQFIQAMRAKFLETPTDVLAKVIIELDRPPAVVNQQFPYNFNPYHNLLAGVGGQNAMAPWLRGGK